MNDEDTILAMNAAYYHAFARGDAQAIEQLWAFDGVTCVHPGWGPLVGRAGVVRSYRDILSNGDGVPITFSDARVVITGDFARVICVERVGGVALAATNCFVRTAQGWLMAHHQASQMAEMELTAPPETSARVLN